MDITGMNRTVPISIETFHPAANAAENREVVRAVQALNATEMFGEDNQLRFQQDPHTQRMVIRVVNVKTDEVLMQIPNEHVLRLAEDFKNQSR